jgi:hypothetical protein
MFPFRTRKPAATPLWNSGHSIRSGDDVEVSRVMVAFVGGTRPERMRGGMGSRSANKGSRDDNVSMPRPTENARDLYKEP